MIESLQNEKIKRLIRLLKKNNERKKEEILLVEGKQENFRARQFGFQSIEYYICESIYDEIPPKGIVHFVNEYVYQKIAYRGSSEGILGIYKAENKRLEDFIPNEQSSVIVVEGVEKPGNLGAILRSCEAFGIDALILTDTKVDLYNPNVVRSSVGCLFGMNMFQCNTKEAYEFLLKNGFNVFTTLMDTDARTLQTLDLEKKSALVFGTEHSGLTDFWKNKGTNAIIPMKGTIDSLNLSNAVAIACYEILRQRTK